MAHTELDLLERRAIEDMLNAKVPVSKIAAEIGRHRSTVYREIARNYFTDEELPYLRGYYGMNAQKYASDRRARRRKLIRLEELRALVIARLKIGWTPEQIAGRLGYDGQPVRISHETIYAYVTASKANPSNWRAIYRTLNIIDEYIRGALMIRVDRKLNSTDMLDALTDLFVLRGPPQ